MQNLKKIVSIWLILVSGISFAETIKEKADKGLFDRNLNITQTLAILGNRSDHTSGQRDNYRDNAIRVLLGDNATTKSYIKTPLSVDDTLTLLKGVYYRANLIAYLTNNKQIKTPLSVDQILQLIDGVGNRGWIITDLANKGLMPNKITPTQMGLLLGNQNNDWAVKAVKTLTGKQLLQNDLNITQTLAILGNRSDHTSGQRDNYRDNAIRVLLGDNATTKSYIKTPLSVDDTLTLLKGVYYRANLIAYLTNNKQIKTPLSVDQILQLIDGVGNRGWIITDLANKGLMPNKITPTQMGLLLGNQNNDWAVKAVKTLTGKQLLQNDLNITQTLAILGNRSDHTSGQRDNYRDNAIRVLLGDNATTKSYIKTPLSVDDTLTLLKGVYYRANLIQYIADYNLIQSGIREDSVVNLIDSNDVKFTNQVIKILSGENLIKKNYFDQFVALSKEEIEKKVIKREFDVVVRTLQSKENFIVYLLKHGYITTEMTIDQVSGLLLSQPTSHRLMTFTSIVNKGLLVANLSRGDIDILITAILGNNCDADTQQSKELITNTVIRLLEGDNSSSKVFFKSQTKDEIIEQEKIKAEVVEIVKVIQQVHFVDFDIVFEGNHWKLGQSAKRELDKLGAVLTSDVLVEGRFELVGHVSGTDGVDKVCIDSEHKYINDDSQAKECFKSQSEWSTILSDRRAKTVEEYLIANYNISSERLESYGVGHSQHKFDDSDNPGNRRVEVRYIKNW